MNSIRNSSSGAFLAKGHLGRPRLLAAAQKSGELPAPFFQARKLPVEQNAAIALSVCDYGYVMRRGQIVVQGTPDELKKNPDVVDAYLS